MVGLPKYCQTKMDWINSVNYAVTNNTGKEYLISKLEALRDNHYLNVLKEESKDKPAEEQTSDDYEQVDNPNAEKYRVGLTDNDINNLIGRLR